MRLRTLSTLFVLAATSIAAMGATDCSENVLDGLIRTVADHEDRIDALEHCACEGVLEPVCAANGKTYVNRCEAWCAKTDVVSEGSCTPPDCGGPDAIACDEGKFCNTQSCDALAPGHCESVPEVCTQNYDPVCGCDGNTYSNACAAASASQSVEHAGECTPPPVACQGNADCQSGEFCDKPAGQCSAEGVCAARPEVCTFHIAPVCGCDGTTYGNACEASAAGAAVASDGECPSSGEPICHIPPGNPGNRHTIFVGGGAVDAHLRHGDYRGPCHDGGH